MSLSVNRQNPLQSPFRNRDSISRLFWLLKLERMIHTRSVCSAKNPPEYILQVPFHYLNTNTGDTCLGKYDV